jgi:hypothetical protein
LEKKEKETMKFVGLLLIIMTVGNPVATPRTQVYHTEEQCRQGVRALGDELLSGEIAPYVKGIVELCVPVNNLVKEKKA